MMDLCFCYVTTGSKEEAVRIGRALVEERLAACVNVLDGAHSIYRWQGATREASEAVLIAKTREVLMPRLTERVKALHGYDCPCIVALPITDGNPAYLAWLEAETLPT